jgi:hypothetical protein
LWSDVDYFYPSTQGKAGEKISFAGDSPFRICEGEIQRLLPINTGEVSAEKYLSAFLRT